MVKNKILLIILVLALAMSGCGKKGPVRPSDTDLSKPADTDKSTQNCCSG